MNIKSSKFPISINLTRPWEKLFIPKYTQKSPKNLQNIPKRSNVAAFFYNKKSLTAKEHAAWFFIIFWCAFAALFGNKAGLQSVDYSTCVAYTTTNIHLSVSESGGCLPDLG